MDHVEGPDLPGPGACRDLQRPARVLARRGLAPRVRNGVARPTPSDPDLLVRPEDPSREYAFLEVEDQGHGIHPGLRARILEPYFSTREDGKGIGLAAVASTVRSVGGGLATESRPGEGTRVRLYLPLAAAAHEAAAG